MNKIEKLLKGLNILRDLARSGLSYKSNVTEEEYLNLRKIEQAAEDAINILQENVDKAKIV